MSISSGFLAGQQVATQAQNQKAGLLNALIRRPTSRRSAVQAGGGYSEKKHEIESFEAADKREATEKAEADRQVMLQEEHDQKMERAELENEILGKAQSERETKAAYEAEDRAKAAPAKRQARMLQQKAGEDALDYQEQMRHYKAYSDAVYRGDATAADRHFRGMYPGMGGETGTATVKRQARDSEGKPLFKDGEPVMKETKYGYRGEPMSDEEVEKQRLSYPRHRSDGGVVYMQFGDDTPIPVGAGRLRQIHASINQSMMQPVGGGAAGAGGAGGGQRAVSAKDASQIAFNNVKKGAAIVAGGVKYAEAKPAPREEGVEYDPLNPPEKTAQQFQKDFVEGMGVISKLSGAKQKEAGIGSAVRPLSPQASKQFARRSREWFDKTIESGSPPPDIRQMMERAKTEHGLGAVHEMAKVFAPELTPSNLTFKSDSAKETPDFGHGKDNVLHVFDKDLGPDGLGIAIDKTTKQPKRWDKNSKGWIPIEPQVLRAYVNLLNEKANQGDKTAEKMLAALEAPRMRPFSFKELMAPIKSFVQRAGTAISETAKEEVGAMGRWADGGTQEEPLQDFGPKSDVSLMRENYRQAPGQ